MNPETALEAIRAKINGEWDNPALVSLGPLSTTPHDLLRILEACPQVAPQSDVIAAINSHAQGVRDGLRLVARLNGIGTIYSFEHVRGGAVLTSQVVEFNTDAAHRIAAGDLPLAIDWEAIARREGWEPAYSIGNQYLYHRNLDRVWLADDWEGAARDLGIGDDGTYGDESGEAAA